MTDRTVCTCPGDTGSVPTSELAYGYAKGCPLHGWTNEDPPISQEVGDFHDDSALTAVEWLRG